MAEREPFFSETALDALAVSFAIATPLLLLCLMLASARHLAEAQRYTAIFQAQRNFLECRKTMGTAYAVCGKFPTLEDKSND